MDHVPSVCGHPHSEFLPSHLKISLSPDQIRPLVSHMTSVCGHLHPESHTPPCRPMWKQTLLHAVSRPSWSPSLSSSLQTLCCNFSIPFSILTSLFACSYFISHALYLGLYSPIPRWCATSQRLHGNNLIIVQTGGTIVGGVGELPSMVATSPGFTRIVLFLLLPALENM